MTSGHGVKPVWLVKPSDKRRKDEDIAEAMLGKIITAEEATFNRAPKLKPSSKTGGSSGTDGGRGSSPSSSNSHGSPTNLSDDSNSNAGGKGKRKRDEFDGTNNSGSDRANKEQRNTVTFSQEEVSNTTTSGSKKSKTIQGTKEDTSKGVGEGGRRVGTRSSGDAEIIPELPSKRKIGIKRVKKVKKDDNVTIVKMLTGTLYMYRGDRPRAEFVRFK